MSQTTTRQHYTASFKADVIMRITEQGYTCRQAGQQLGIPYQILGKGYDNAAVESFGGKLRTEPISRRTFKSRAEARRSTFLGIEGGSTRRRRHAALGCKSPEPFEASLN